jgi:hypothetical protein
MTPYTPAFKCEYCGVLTSSQVFGEEGIFVPCQCDASRQNRDRDHYINMERKKRARSAVRGRRQ